ncbi:MAG TPA: peroxiredoxin [Thermoanaerobaculia bacterium]|nr:peroxiredoxin [Thermoanaerobaculia bacterium]
MSIRVGEPAPDFALRGTQSDDPVSLSSFQGRQNVVLLFFPLAWTSVCTKELCSIRDSYAEYGKLNAQVLGISVDSPFALKAWSKEEGFPFPLLSDFNREVSASYGALYENLMGLKGVAKRAAFVVDRAGVVRHAQVLDKASDLPDFTAVQRVLSDIG